MERREKGASKRGAGRAATAEGVGGTRAQWQQPLGDAYRIAHPLSPDDGPATTPAPRAPHPSLASSRLLSDLSSLSSPPLCPVTSLLPHCIFDPH